MIKKLSIIFLSIFMVVQLGIGVVNLNATENLDVTQYENNSKNQLIMDNVYNENIELIEQVPDDSIIVDYKFTDSKEYTELEDVPYQLRNDVIAVTQELLVSDKINEYNLLSENYNITYNGFDFFFYNDNGNVVLDVDDYQILIVQNDYIDTIALKKDSRSSYRYVRTRYVKNTSWQKWFGGVALVGQFVPGYGKIVAAAMGSVATIGSFVQVEKYGIQDQYVNREKSCDWKHITKWYTYNNHTGYINTSTSYMKTSQYC